ncbi:YafY family transcriptional regulator [Mycobacterium sp. CBMA271]|uniref:helix-turn-helix transcriptional regulator n=1 Tax=unclassified Mycobacteroides TaxID=2618759 RepID=UPI0012DF6229|nr:MULTISPECIES: YafY family protein [unclassified Mycobacteroides]MUM18293.1 DNA-binding transcriptional regulator [Mycobacteroides sp. CBMA 326]MUM20879.1 YafY family transcriptional regulator [Mycobacteroides sp. CBMA 271]
MRNDPTGRALQLLSLLQTHRFWHCAELAARLDVTQRTVRRDIDRLRDLGYPVDSTSGKYGGYRLATGAHVPPLILDDDESVAVAVGLRYAAEAAISGIEETSLRALTKIETLLPHRLRRRVSALHSSVSSMRRVDDDIVDPEALSVLAAACRDHEHVRFDYRRGDGESSRRLVEPHRLVTAGRRWYLVAWDHHRADWRTFRLDRLSEPWLAGSHFTPREIPGGDAAGFVARSVGSPPRHHDAKLAIEATFADLEGVLRWIDHTPIEVAGDRCLVQIRSEDLGRLTMTVARIALTSPVVVIEPTELADTVSRLALHLTVSPP